MKRKNLQVGCRDPQFENKQQPLYFVSTMGEVDRCIGYYKTLQYARDVVKHNCKSLCEFGCYKYAVIEAFGPGWYPQAEIEEWYEFVDKGTKAKKIEKPKRYGNQCNFGIG